MNASLGYPVHPAWRTSMAGPLTAHQRAPWKPAVLPRNPALDLGQADAGSLKAAATAVLLIPTVAAAAVSYVGFKFGMQNAGFDSILGYIVGVLSGVTAIMGVLTVLGVASLPLTPTPAPASRPQEMVTVPVA